MKTPASKDTKTGAASTKSTTKKSTSKTDTKSGKGTTKK
jgi:hypothetical protein